MDTAAVRVRKSAIGQHGAEREADCAVGLTDTIPIEGYGDLYCLIGVAFNGMVHLVVHCMMYD